MLKSLGTEFKVGLFVIVAMTTLGYMFFVITPDFFQNTQYARYYTVLDNAAGIVPKTHVMTAGVTVGKVMKVGLEGGQTRVALEVDKSVKVPIGSHVEIRSVGLLGDKHIEIVRAPDQGQYIQDGGMIPQSTENVDMEHLIALVGDIAKDVKKVTNTLANVLGTKNGERSIENILQNIEGMTADLRATSQTIKEVVGDRPEDLNEIVTNVRDGVRDLRRVASNLKDVVSDENKARVNHILAQFDETMGDVKGSAKNINLISEKVEKGEGTIGKLVNDDETLTELEGAIKDIRKALAPVNKLEIDVAYRGEFRADQSSQHFFDILWKTRPDRYYVLGLTEVDYDVQDTTTVSAPTNQPGGTRIIQYQKETKEIRFDAQMAKRWYWAQARFGLFETTGGIAGDFFAFDDKLKLTAEAFDWNTQDKTIRRNAHLKAYASVLFYNHVSALVGLDDPTKTDPATNKARKLNQDFMIGAGLTFSDDDLKSLIGTAAVAGAAAR